MEISSKMWCHNIKLCQKLEKQANGNPTGNLGAIVKS
jgi:hypothetical protein